MKRITSVILILMLLSISLPLHALAETAGWYQVDSTRGYAYLYSNASDRDAVSRNLGKYINGQVVYVMEYNGGREGQYYYHYVQTQDGKTGYMHASALRRTYASNWDATSEGWYMVNSSSPRGYAYLYSAASDRDEMGYNKGRYDNGEMVYVMDYYGGQDGKYNYCYVKTQDGKTGYMHDYSLTPCFGYTEEDDSGIDHLSALPRLTYQCSGTANNGTTPVYTGPGTHYYRTASGNACVGGGSSVIIYGREGDYYLVRYNGTSSGRSVVRCSMIHVSQLSPRSNVDMLSFAWTPIRIAGGAHIADAPDWAHSYNTITVNRDNAYALAQITDSDGTTWVYFESIGYTSSGYVSVRGFVPMSEVSLR